MEPSYFLYIAVGMGILALIFAILKYSFISKVDPGNERMKEIAGYIEKGAMTFLKRQYKSLAVSH